MKLTVALAAAFAGCVAAAQQAEVYMIPNPDNSLPQATISRSLARLILLQRLAPSGKGPSTSDIPDGSDPEEIVSMMNQFGKAPAPLFTDGEATAPRQLVVLVEGVTDTEMDTTKKAFGGAPAFTISNPPSDAAHERLVTNDFYNVGVAKDTECSLLELTGYFSDPSMERCWSGRSAVKRLNMQNGPLELHEDVLSHIALLQKNAKNQEIDTTVVFLPVVADSSSTKSWSEKPQELRRRQEVEQVMSAFDDETSPPAPTSEATSEKEFYFDHPPVPVQSCFTSEDNCASATGNCSGHGSCQNKYAEVDGSEGKEVCYQCYCMSTVNETSGSLTHWAGTSCSKQDVSVAFWLFAGFTLVMVSVLYMAVGMLFSVGEETLPGVIGAGVSRSK